MKKFLLLFIVSIYIGSIAFSASVLISYAQEVDPIFEDLSAYDEHAPAIAYVKDEGMVKGFPDGTFRSEQTINRNELTKTVAQIRSQVRVEQRIFSVSSSSLSSKNKPQK